MEFYLIRMVSDQKFLDRDSVIPAVLKWTFFFPDALILTQEAEARRIRNLLRNQDVDAEIVYCRTKFPNERQYNDRD